LILVLSGDLACRFDAGTASGKPNPNMHTRREPASRVIYSIFFLAFTDDIIVSLRLFMVSPSRRSSVAPIFHWWLHSWPALLFWRFRSRPGMSIGWPLPRYLSRRPRL
jgi:hypothetical protein